MILIHFMPLPDSSEKHNDLIDLIIQSAQKTVDINNGDGTISREMQMDADSHWWKTRSEERRVGKECRSRWSP